MGYPSGQRAPFEEINELVSLVGWVPEQLSNDVQELAEDQLKMKSLGIIRALWRGGAGILIVDEEKESNKEETDNIYRLISKLSNKKITVIVLTTDSKKYSAVCSQSIKIGTIIEEMMAAEKIWLQT